MFRFVVKVGNVGNLWVRWRTKGYGATEIAYAAGSKRCLIELPRVPGDAENMPRDAAAVPGERRRVRFEARKVPLGDCKGYAAGSKAYAADLAAYGIFRAW